MLNLLNNLLKKQNIKELSCSKSAEKKGFKRDFFISFQKALEIIEILKCYKFVPLSQFSIVGVFILL